jgi:hypothetical protein
MPHQQTRSLFSQHFLTQRLPLLDDWRVEIEKVYSDFRALYANKQNILSQLNEAQTEQEFIRPALDLLGFAYVPQTSFRRAGRTQRPDYTLFAHDAVKREAQTQLHQESAFYSRALAVLDAKYWGRWLSEQRRDDPRDAFKNANPSFQMVNYLTGTGVDWGILTNGETWRLYYRLASSTATEFYEVQLIDLLEQDDAAAFKYFYLFFRRAAFERDAQGQSFLERVRAESMTYARVVGDQLKELVYDEVFPALAGGLVTDRHHKGITRETEETCAEIYQATLSLLYKLLFLFYAEARALLPTHHAGYRDASLATIAKQAAERIDKARPLGETSTRLYTNLLDLFDVIDRGDRNLQLPRYNGGLFNRRPAMNQFLKEHRIADDRMARALDKLWRADAEPIDYGFIDVRTLGAIYEGLLEYKLNVDDARAGVVHLATDKGERKATGSYYTPDYVVAHIVKHTLEPILAEREQQFAAWMEKCAELQTKRKRARNPETIRTWQRELDSAQQQAVESLLDIKICDPAMGSGHFLVEAVDYLTDRIIRIVNRYPDDNPVLTMLARIRQIIVADLQQQGIAIEPTRLDDTALLMRVVLKRCIYGVDLNEMAVELAKVSLWLHSFTIGAPLSFLDHHLRWGNSLVGALAQRVQTEFAGELPLLGSPFEGVLAAAKTMQEISLLSDATIGDVEQSANLFQFFEKEALPYKRLLDIYLMRYFGVKRADEFLRLYQMDVLTVSPEKIGPPYREVFEKREQLYREKRFFHWDLEFPEVFIDLAHTMWKADVGFDAVIGNPPYVDVTADAYYKKFYTTASARNLYAYMLEKACHITKPSGMIGMIVPLSLICADRMEVLRAELKAICAEVRVANFGIRPARIFPNVEQRTTILVARKKSVPTEAARIFATRLHRWHKGQEQAMLDQLSFAEITELPDAMGWAKLGDETGRSIARKLFAQTKHIGDYIGDGWTFYFHGIGRYWLKAYDFEPTFLDAKGKPRRSTTLGEMSAQNETVGRVLIAIINSSLFFWYWILFGDEFHLLADELKAFPFTHYQRHQRVYRELLEAVSELMNDYQKHSVLKRGKYPTGTITYQEFYPRHSKAIIHRIDDLLGMIYGLEREEVEYLKRYDMAFRGEED